MSEGFEINSGLTPSKEKAGAEGMSLGISVCCDTKLSCDKSGKQNKRNKKIIIGFMMEN